MTLTTKLEKHIKQLEEQGKIISITSSTRILQSYYRSLGVDSSTTFHEWMHSIASNRYPVYSSVTRAIRKARELHPKWKKQRNTVDNQIRDIREEVGY